MAGRLGGLIQRSGRPLAVGATAIVLLVAGPLDGRPPSSAAAQEAAASAIYVATQPQLLSVDVHGVPLVDVLRVIGKQAGVVVTIRGDVSAPVTQSFAGLPLDEGIRRLAGRHALVLSYGPSGDRAGADVLTSVWVSGSSSAEQGSTGIDEGGRAAEPDAPRAPASPRDKTAAAELARTLSGDPDPIVRALAVAALGQVGKGEAAAALIAALGDRSISVRIQAVRTLRWLEGARAVWALGGVLIGDPDPRVRRVVARELAALHGEEVRWALEAAASDPDEAVRQEVAAALARWREHPR